MGRTTQQKAQRNQQREQNKTRLLQGIQDARGILPLDIPDALEDASRPARQESVVFVLHQDLEAAQVVLFEWISLLAIKQADPAYLDLNLAFHYVKVLPQEKEPEPSTALPTSTSASDSIKRFLNHLFRLYNNHLLMYGSAFCFMRFALPHVISSPPTLESPRKAALSIDSNKASRSYLMYTHTEL
ncbi:hypothetical protein JCM11641_001955 [Rhodosporidiobolus odoratus]